MKPIQLIHETDLGKKLATLGDGLPSLAKESIRHTCSFAEFTGWTDFSDRGRREVRLFTKVVLTAKYSEVDTGVWEVSCAALGEEIGVIRYDEDVTNGEGSYRFGAAEDWFKIPGAVTLNQALCALAAAIWG